MKPAPIHGAKTNLSRLIARACAGDDVLIARGDTRVVRLVAVGPVKGRRPGELTGLRTLLGHLTFHGAPPQWPY
jgi:antitoxin (DNA-binding transcriptional repressor) of toxin-antitoxin stability system